MKTISLIFQRAIYLIILFVFFIASCDKETADNAEPESTILFPSDGGVFLTGNTYTITWLDEKSTTVRIKLYKSGLTASNITSNTENNGEFTWTFPIDLEEGNDYTIKISSNDDDFVYAESEFPFSVINKPNEFSEFIDIKDGQTYKTIKIGDQWWMAENYNYVSKDSYCYDGNPDICDEIGRHYTLYIAKVIAPPGWHLPTDSDWKQLESYLGVPMDDLNKETYRGSNAGLLLKDGGGLGFDAIYAGYTWPRSIRSNGINEIATFWTSTYDSRETIYWSRELSADKDGIKRLKTWANYNALSVRYVKDN